MVCGNGMPLELVEHFLVECLGYKNQRKSCFLKAIKEDSDQLDNKQICT